MFRPHRDEIHALIEAAIAAPSADNRHHVRFVVRETALAVVADAFYASCREPHLRFLAELSFGAIAENIRVWLALRGFDFRPRWFPSEREPQVLFVVAWDALAPVAASEPLAAAIATRHTNRRFFRGPRLTAVERGVLDACAKDRADLRIDWFDDRRRRAALLGLMRLAETTRFRDSGHHAELFGSIAFDAGWSTPTTEHLAPGSLEVEWPMRGAFAALRRWPAMRLANRLGASTLLGWRAGDLPARWSPHVLVIASRSRRPDVALEGGALFERVWLAAESLGLALQPMAASAVLTEDPSCGQVLRAGWAALLGAEWQAMMVCRLGHARRPTIRSLRKPVPAYLSTPDAGDAA